MKRREQKRKWHDELRVIEIELPGGFLGKHHFRAPSPMVSGRLLSVSANSEDQGDLCRFFGLLVGSTWFNEEHDLESVNNGGGQMAYGESVYEELFDAGYTHEFITLMADVITLEMLNSTKVSEEVNERLNFYKARTEDSEPLSSSPAETPTETSTT